MLKKFQAIRKRWFLWMGFVVATDLVFMIYLLLFPNSFIYELAVDFKWGITPSWVGTTIAVIILMASILWQIAKKDYVFTDEWYTVFAVISLIWVAELVIYESLIGAYHWTKIADALRWLSFWYASYRVNKIDAYVIPF